MKKIIINQLDDCLIQYLNKKKINSSNGKIISKFKNVINIEFEILDCLIVIATSEVVLSPYMMIIDNRDIFDQIRESVKIGAVVYISHHKEEITIGKFKLSYKNTDKWSSKIEKNDNIKNIKKDYFFTREILLKYGLSNPLTKSFLCIDKEIKKENIQNIYITMFTKLLSELNSELSFENLKKFIGLGVGLTPSGDDFIVGLLATFHYYSFFNNQVKRLFNLFNKYYFKNKTTCIGFYTITHSIHGRVNHGIYDYLSTIQHNNENNCRQFEIIDIGSTSGIDMLTGICFGMQYLKNKKEKYDEK